MEIISVSSKARWSIRTVSAPAPSFAPAMWRMSAGTGIQHSEFNHSKSEPVHFLQVWLLPNEQGLSPGYEQKTFVDSEKRGQLRLVAASDGRGGSVVIHQDAEIYASILNKKEQVEHVLPAGRNGWLQVVRGAVELNGQSRALATVRR